jgi:Asp-tRNA(Asn)/Glu-tRNA(Gln) amidotransferase C subunit
MFSTASNVEPVSPTSQLKLNSDTEEHMPAFFKYLSQQESIDEYFENLFQVDIESSECVMHCVYSVASLAGT